MVGRMAMECLGVIGSTPVCTRRSSTSTYVGSIDKILHHWIVHKMEPPNKGPVFVLLREVVLFLEVASVL